VCSEGVHHAENVLRERQRESEVREKESESIRKIQKVSCNVLLLCMCI